MIELKSNNKNNDIAIVALHGYGSNSSNMSDLLSAINIKDVNCYFPSGTIELYHNNISKAWFSIPFATYLEDEILKSRQSILLQIDQLRNNGYSYKKIILLGFSQGAMMCLDIMINLPKPILGVVCLSGLNITINENTKIDNKFKTTPVYVGHGIYDDVIDLQSAKSSFQLLSRQGFKVNWKEYKLSHEVGENEIIDIKSFVKKISI